MRYSRFVPESGDYEIYEDRFGQAGHPINADLPTPAFGRVAGRVGIPASDAGRRLPPGARRVGRSWRPEGQIVIGGSAGFSGTVGETIVAHPVVAVTVAGLAMWGLFRLYVGSMQSWGER